MPSRTSRLSSAITTRMTPSLPNPAANVEPLWLRDAGHGDTLAFEPRPTATTFHQTTALLQREPKARSCRNGSPRMRERAPDWGGACLCPGLGCSWSWPRSSSAARVTSRRRSAAASCRPARSSRPTPGACTAASRAPTRWPATASPTRCADAEAADERIAAAGPDDELPPFLGVPCTIKESIALRGMPNCAGMVALRDRRSETTAPGGPAADRRGLHPARRDEHVGADDVDRVRQPRLRPDPQRLRPAAHRRRLVRRRGRGGRLGRLAGRPRLGHRRLDPRARVLQRRLRPQAVARPGAEHRPVPERPTARRRSCSRSARSPATPRT